MRKCSICGNVFDRFVAIEQKYITMPKEYGRINEVEPELLNKEEYSCPYCYSADRDRMIVMFLRKICSQMKQGIDFLEIAPSGALQRFLYSDWGKSTLYTADLFMEGVDYTADIQDMFEIPDGRFDFIICSHVLEHVQDDRKAMRELWRVLDYKGLGIIIVPMDLSRAYTDEEWGLSEEENWKRFGQGDHVRAYNKNDYIKRLEESGFGVHQIDKSFFTDEEFSENALINTSTLYLVYKNKEIYGDKGLVVENYIEAHENLDVKKEYPILNDSINQWIDLCKVENDILKIWGWAYFQHKDSRRSKFKLLLEGSEKEYIYSIPIRKRPDIQETFCDSNGEYTFSGIDVQLSICNIAKGIYKVYLLIGNENMKSRITLNDELIIG